MIFLPICVHFVFFFLLDSSRATPIAGGFPSLTERDVPVSTACGDIVNSGGKEFPLQSLFQVRTNILLPSELVFDASLVYKCLTSVPFNAAVATRFIQYYNDAIKFQSTLAYLKNPPSSYQQPPVDFARGLERIQAKINNGAFANQYEFEAGLQALIYSTHDAHVNLISGILGVFSFGSQYSIASVSIDGIQLPKVYLSGKSITSSL